MSEKLRVVQFESPFGAPDADGVVRNVAYALAGMRDSLQRGEAPFASHLLYTQMLDDTIADERAMGIDAGLEIGKAAELTVVYADLGVSRGMQYGIDKANEIGRPVEFRHLYAPLLETALLYEQILTRSPLDPQLIRQIYARGM